MHSKRPNFQNFPGRGCSQTAHFWCALSIVRLLLRFCRLNKFLLKTLQWMIWVVRMTAEACIPPNSSVFPRSFKKSFRCPDTTPKQPTHMTCTCTKGHTSLLSLSSFSNHTIDLTFIMFPCQIFTAIGPNLIPP